jgi:hypothetical protein
MNVKQFRSAIEVALEVSMTSEHSQVGTAAECEAARCKTFAHLISRTLRELDPALSKKLQALRGEHFWQGE